MHTLRLYTNEGSRTVTLESWRKRSQRELFKFNRVNLVFRNLLSNDGLRNRLYSFADCLALFEMSLKSTKNCFDETYQHRMSLKNKYLVQIRPHSLNEFV